MADPIAARSTFLCLYMSDHPDTLVAYVRHWGKVAEQVVDAKMTKIDTKGMNITYTTATSGSSKKETRVLFDPPLAEYGEVKARLLQMKVEAENALGMIKTPTITDFRFPSAARGTAILVGALAYTTFAPSPDSPFYNAAFHPAGLIRGALPWGLSSIWAVLLAAHSAECVYTYSLCRKHKTPLIPTTLYLLTTLLFGFPGFTDLRKRAQKARIDSIVQEK